MPTLALSADDAGVLYTRHHGWLHNWLWRRIGCREGAADIAHDIFVRLLDAGVLEPLREPRAYLSIIANGLLVNHWRRQDLERAYLDALAQWQEAQAHALAPSPEEHALVIEALMQVDAMLGRLPPKVRLAFLLSQIDGLTYIEIAERLQVSERMVKKYMAKAMLQCLLIGNGNGLG